MKINSGIYIEHILYPTLEYDSVRAIIFTWICFSIITIAYITSTHTLLLKYANTSTYCYLYSLNYWKLLVHFQNLRSDCGNT